MRAVLVCVDFSDLLTITLPYNRHHFDEVLVVTSPADLETKRVAGLHGAAVHRTHAFYRDGATFNKFRALEEGLDVMKREGWICIMDADVLWPKVIELDMQKGFLYTPRRRMMLDVTALKHGVPPESEWEGFPLHPQEREWAGYTQIFHADDPHLGDEPWHEIDWAHAGGADSLFQAKWPKECKVRPDFEVLHLGPAGQNWAGRATQLVDGSVPHDSMRRLKQVRDFIKGRATPGHDRFAGEKIKIAAPLR